MEKTWRHFLLRVKVINNIFKVALDTRRLIAELFKQVSFLYWQIQTSRRRLILAENKYIFHIAYLKKKFKKIKKYNLLIKVKINRNEK